MRLAPHAGIVVSIRHNRHSSDSGFSLIELLLVCVLATTVAAMSVGFFRAARSTSMGNANARKVETLLKLARETAINQRRAVTLTFTNPNRIRLTRQNLPNGTTQIADEYLENSMSFLLFAGQADTPDGFGHNAAIDFGAAVTVMFTAEGTLTDQLGNPVNGTIYIGLAGNVQTSRALTIFGPTATLRTYAWNGSSWRR